MSDTPDEVCAEICAEVPGQLSIDDTAPAEQPAPDPGNAEPDQWSTDLDEAARDRAFDLVNSVAVDLPEPDLDGDPRTTPDGA